MDRQQLLHHALGVVDDAVEGDVGQHQQAHAVQLALAPQVEQLLLQRAQRDAAVDREATAADTRPGTRGRAPASASP